MCWKFSVSLLCTATISVTPVESGLALQRTGLCWKSRVDESLRIRARKCFMFTDKFCWVFLYIYLFISMSEVKGRGAAGDGYTWGKDDSEQNVPSVYEPPALLPCQSSCHAGTLARLRNGGHRNHVSKTNPENHMAQALPGGRVLPQICWITRFARPLFSLWDMLCVCSHP